MLQVSESSSWSLSGCRNTDAGDTGAYLEAIDLIEHELKVSHY